LSSRLIDPLPSSLHPLLFTWERARPFIRCHNVRYGAMEFNPGKGDGRFHPFLNPHGQFVPTLYAADHLEGALSETVFRDVPVRGPGKRLRRSVLEPLAASTLVCERDLILAQLFGFGLRRLGVTRLELIESESDQYPRTRAWAKALHACDARVDGLIWVSRQHDGTRSVVLFGDRVPSSALRTIGNSLPLKDGPGYDAVLNAADRAGIVLYD
jgi:RES domain